MTHQPVMNADEVTAYVRKVFPQADGYGWRAQEVA